MLAEGWAVMSKTLTNQSAFSALGSLKARRAKAPASEIREVWIRTSPHTKICRKMSRGVDKQAF
jgi:hypothetical protein